MPRWRVRIHRRVRKWLKKHPLYEEDFWEALKELSCNPFVGEKLKGRCKGFLKWKKKGSPLRIMYAVDRRDHMIFVEAVGLRENFYEKYC